MGLRDAQWVTLCLTVTCVARRPPPAAPCRCADLTVTARSDNGVGIAPEYKDRMFRVGRVSRLRAKKPLPHQRTRCGSVLVFRRPSSSSVRASCRRAAAAGSGCRSFGKSSICTVRERVVCAGGGSVPLLSLIARPRRAGGRITVQSEEGRGSSFTVVLPVALCPAGLLAESPPMKARRVPTRSFMTFSRRERHARRALTRWLLLARCALSLSGRVLSRPVQGRRPCRPWSSRPRRPRKRTRSAARQPTSSRRRSRHRRRSERRRGTRRAKLFSSVRGRARAPLCDPCSRCACSRRQPLEPHDPGARSARSYRRQCRRTRRRPRGCEHSRPSL
jgi:hypothetical protein